MINLIKNIIYGFKIIGTCLFKKRIPLSISIHLTNKCNYNCNYCHIHKRPQKGEMSKEQIISMIDEFKKLGTQKIGFSGGEPLLRKDIGELISYAKDKGMITSITTNGFLIPEKIDELKDLDLALVSFDGYDTKGKETKEELLKKIIMLKNKGINVWTITLLTKKAINNLDYIFNKSKEIRYKILFQPVNTSYSLYNKKKYSNLPSQIELKTAIKKIIEKKKEGIIANSSPYLKLIYDEFVNKSYVCLAGKNYCNIDFDGEVYPCGVLFKQIKASNGVKETFKKAFNDIPTNFKCTGCQFPCYLENDLLFSLNAGGIINIIKNLK